MSSSARGSSPLSSRPPDGRSRPAATVLGAEPAELSDRKGVREGPLARDPSRAAGLRAAGAAAARDPDPHQRRPVLRGLLRVQRDRHGDRQGRRANAVPRGGGAGRHLLCAERPRAGARSAARHRLPDHPLSVPAREHLGPRHARRLSARAAQSRVVRGTLHAAAAAGRGAAPRRIQDRTRPVTRVAVLGAGAWGTAIATVLSSRLERRVAVLGAGAWGTAIATVLSSRLEVALWARDAAQAAAIAGTRRNERYLPGIALPRQVEVEADLAVALDGAELALAATPVAGLREVLPKVRL